MKPAGRPCLQGTGAGCWLLLYLSSDYVSSGYPDLAEPFRTTRFAISRPCISSHANSVYSHVLEIVQETLQTFDIGHCITPTLRNAALFMRETGQIPHNEEVKYVCLAASVELCKEAYAKQSSCLWSRPPLHVHSLTQSIHMCLTTGGESDIENMRQIKLKSSLINLIDKRDFK